MTKLTHWDPVVKVTHWCVACLFLVNYFVTKAGSSLHQYIGYGVVALVAIRLLWGMITRSPARLSLFLPSIPKAFVHLKEVLTTKQDSHQGHNPAGAVMIWAMWFGLLVTGISGFMMETDQFWGEDWVEVIHEAAVNVTFVCVCVHISAVVIMSKLTGHPYMRGMLPRLLKDKRK